MLLRPRGRTGKGPSAFSSRGDGPEVGLVVRVRVEGELYVCQEEIRHGYLWGLLDCV